MDTNERLTYCKENFNNLAQSTWVALFDLHAVAIPQSYLDNWFNSYPFYVILKGFESVETYLKKHRSMGVQHALRYATKVMSTLMEPRILEEEILHLRSDKEAVLEQRVVAIENKISSMERMVVREWLG